MKPKQLRDGAEIMAKAMESPGFEEGMIALRCGLAVCLRREDYAPD
jgi:hypothetical protein